jgi:hypothetical protein
VTKEEADKKGRGSSSMIGRLLVMILLMMRRPVCEIEKGGMVQSV